MAGAWQETTVETLRKAGFRRGGARSAVIDLLGRQSCCLSAQQIFDALRDEGRQVGIATVYRVLEQLAEQDLVQRVDVGDGLARYEPVLPHGGHHHHVVCEDCGRVEPFEDTSLERAIDRLGERLGYDVGGHEVVLRGACDDCRG